MSKKILIVEDEAIIACDLQNSLTGMGYAVAGIAVSGSEAIEMTHRCKPDVVLMDIILHGDMDGTAAGELILQRHHTPVVYVTSHSDYPTRCRATRTAPYGYVVKPFNEQELQTTIEIALRRQEMEQRVKRAERSLTATLRSIGDAIIATDAVGRIRFMNPVAEDLTGWEESEVVGRELDSAFLTFTPCSGQCGESHLRENPQPGTPTSAGQEMVLISMGGRQRPIESTWAPIRDEDGHLTGGIHVFRDISERKTQEAEREQLIAKLREALANVNTLRGLLPICSWCKSVRDDDGYWQRVEDYITAHSEAQFTHGICPRCFERQIVGFPPG
jgi:PAS domain S-box-containing protein